MKAIWRGKVIAESDTTVELHGYRYFPRDAVRMDMLTPAPKSGSDLECPHGVQFYDIAQGKEKSPRAASRPRRNKKRREYRAGPPGPMKSRARR